MLGQYYLIQSINYMKLTENFSLAELTKSQTATRLGFDNKPNQNQVLALTKLCENVLQPIRNKFEMPVFISSGFRSARLSEAIGSSSKSQHCKGEAADIEIFGLDNKILANWINNNIKYDQLILEFYKPSDPQSGWVHVSYTDDCRKQFLKAYKDAKGKTRYIPWQ